MPAIRIGSRDYEEIAVRQIREPVLTNITSIALPTGAATEATLAQVRDAIKASLDLESTIWTDNSGAYYVRRDLVDQGTGAITITWTTPSGSAATPGAGLKPLATAERDVTQDLYEATGSGTGYSSGDLLARLLIVDANPATPVITQLWYNFSTSAVIAAPPGADVSPVGETVSIGSSALPTGAATAARQDTLISHVDGVEGLLTTIDGDTGAIDAKLPSGLTVSSSRLKVDGSEVTQPISAAALPLPADAATATKQDTLIGHVDGIEGLLGTIDADTGAIDGKLPSGLTVSSTRLLVDGSGATQPTSVAVRTPTTTSVASSATSVTVLASNGSRRGVSVANLSTAKLYLSFSAPATTANCFIEIPAGGFLLLDQQLIVTNALYGLWASANGTAQITEYV